MREIFVRIENNHYLTAGASGHGFEGYFDTNQGDESIWAGQDDLLAVLGTVSEGLGQDPDDLVDNLVADVNFLSSIRDQSQGVFGSALHVDAMWRRFSSRDYVLDTAGATNANGDQKYPLYVQLNTLATKVLFEDETANQPRKAIGVELLQGQSMYSADPRYDPTDSGTLERAYARKEVILAGGTFNSPQLLKLSGIGPAAELAQFDIPLVVALPGVGTNLQDNYEVPIVGHAAANFTGPPPDPNDPICTFGAPGDPCIPLWEQGEGPYTGSMGTLNAIFRKSAYPAVNERDVFMAGGTFAIHGFWPPTDSVPADPPNTFALSTVKIHSQSHSGRVLLKSSNPRDTPDINFNLFEPNNEGTTMDLNAELDTIKWARRTFANVPGPIGPIEPIEPPCAGTPASDGSCDDEADKEWVMDQTFGHHCTSTCAIGADNDEMAVLDSKFRVRGVRGLRVVDASAFPRTPGPFPVLPTFMLSEKATESVLEDANSW
jgi:choline dehydrogenase